MDASLLLRVAVEPALEWILPEMDSPEARRMLLAIAGQESGFTHRLQVGGPARGWWQFEYPIIDGLRKHEATKHYIPRVMLELGYDPGMPTMQIHATLTDNDVLAACFARLNLRWYPHALPTAEQPAWGQYAAIWRPGKPHPNRWPGNWKAASEVV